MYLSGAGSAAASGTVNFYGVGTLVPAIVYADDTLSTPLTQPITLDASGKLPSPVYTATPLRMIVKSSGGTTLYDVARLDGDRAELVGVSNAAWTATDLNSVLTAVQSSLGGTDARFLAASAGAVARNVQAKFSEVQLSVKDFGAVGNGIADDTVAIQATITSVRTAGGGTVYIPPGTYKITSTLTLSTNSVIIAGAGIGTSIISNAGTGAVITLSNGTYRAAIRDLQISGGSSAGSAISVAGGTATYLERIYIDGIAKAVSGAGGTIYMYSSTLIGTTTAVDTTGPVYAMATSFTGASTYGLTVVGSVQVYLTGCTLGGPTAGLNIGAGASLTAAGCVSGFGSPGLNIAVGAGEVLSGGCDWGTVTDGRTGAPVNYVFAGANNMTPLPNQADVIRVEQQTGGVVTTINNISTMYMGKEFTLVCTNTSGGASNFTFGAAYVLSAAVAPAAANRVALKLYYDPRTSKVYEVGRAATAN